MCHPHMTETAPEQYCIKPLVNVMWVNIATYMLSLAYKLDGNILVVKNHFLLLFHP